MFNVQESFLVKKNFNQAKNILKKLEWDEKATNKTKDHLLTQIYERKVLSATVIHDKDDKKGESRVRYDQNQCKDQIVPITESNHTKN